MAVARVDGRDHVPAHAEAGGTERRLAAARTPVPSDIAPSKNATVPVGVPEPGGAALTIWFDSPLGDEKRVRVSPRRETRDETTLKLFSANALQVRSPARLP
jgi:hypothetical protein